MTRVLLVEDEPDLADPLAYLLRREGYEVEIADNGPGAVEAFRARGADIILLDLMLPGMSGTLDSARTLRATSVPLMPGSIRSSRMMSAPRARKASTAPGPLSAISTS